MIPTWAQLVYLICAVCFILALKGLSGPKTARAGNLLGAAAAVVACALPFFYLEDLQHVAPMLAAIAVGTVAGVLRRPAGADDPDAADGRALQRGRWRRGGAGGAARAQRDRGRGSDVQPRRDRLHHRRRRDLVRRVRGHVREAAGPDDLASGHLPGLPDRLRRLAGRRAGAERPGGPRSHDRPRHRDRPGRAADRRAARAARRRGRRPDRDLAAQRLHRPQRGRERLRPGQHVAARRRHPGRRLRNLPDPADGQGDGPLGDQHPVRGAQGRLDPGWRRGLRPAGAHGDPGGRRDHAGVRRPGHHHPRLRARGGPGPAHAARAGRPAQRARGQRSTTRSTPSPAGCPVT